MNISDFPVFATISKLLSDVAHGEGNSQVLAVVQIEQSSVFRFCN